MTLLFDREEKEIFKKIQPKNKKDLFIWNLTNLAFPIATILISVLFFYFSNKSPLTLPFWEATKSVFDFILNGAIPLIGINLLVASSFFLIKFDKHKENKLGLKTGFLRLKLILYCLTAYLVLSSLFAIQTISSPFNNLGKQIFMLCVSVLGIYLSLQIANKLFLLQEEFIDKSYDEEISDSVENLRNAIE